MLEDSCPDYNKARLLLADLRRQEYYLFLKGIHSSFRKGDIKNFYKLIKTLLKSFVGKSKIPRILIVLSQMRLK